MSGSQARRDEVPFSRVMEIVPAAGWDDGREGFVWVRFDAVLLPGRDPLRLRAEVTWGDDSEDEGNADGGIRVVFNPELELEVNRAEADGSLARVASRVVKITHEEAAHLVQHAPSGIVERYATEIEALLDDVPRDHWDLLLSRAFAAAEAHGVESEPDHEVGDLQNFLGAAWAQLTPRQRVATLGHPMVLELRDVPEYKDFF